MPPPAPPDLGAIPSDASVNGTWSSVYNWPLIPIHAVLLPDGRLLTYGTDAAGNQTGAFIYDVWSPNQGAAGGHMTLPNGTGTDTFCSAQVVLPTASGDTVIAGGDTFDGTETTNTGNDNSVLFSRASSTLSSGPNMNRPRWYGTMTTLMDGTTYIQGGRGGGDRAEVRASDGTFHLLNSLDTTPYDWYYPRNWVAPDGRLFGYDVYGHMWYIDPTGDGSIVGLPQLAAANRGVDSSAAMFAPGKVLQFGGESNGSVVIDITGGGTPVVTVSGAMSTQRRYVTATLLPNGKVLATGGSSVANQLTDVNLAAEIWDPATGAWTLGASEAVPRLYHSQAILLPDASVLVGGGGAPGPLTNLNVETYYPPYLFTADGKLAPRPAILSAPDSVAKGQSFNVGYGNATSIAKVALVKTGSVTHNWNMDQRYVPLTFSATGTTLSVQMPARTTDTPPGYYLLFLLNASGVPSVGKIVRVL